MQASGLLGLDILRTGKSTEDFTKVLVKKRKDLRHKVQEKISNLVRAACMMKSAVIKH